MREVASHLGLALLLGFLLGCEGDNSGPVFAVGDSAGVPMYTLSALPSWDVPKHRWEVRIEWSLSTAEPSPADEPLLYQPQAYARLNDQTLVVLDGGELRLAVIDLVRGPAVAGVVVPHPVDHLPWFWKVFLENPERWVGL